MLSKSYINKILIFTSLLTFSILLVQPSLAFTVNCPDCQPHETCTCILSLTQNCSLGEWSIVNSRGTEPLDNPVNESVPPYEVSYTPQREGWIEGSAYCYSPGPFRSDSNEARIGYGVTTSTSSTTTISTSTTSSTSTTIPPGEPYLSCSPSSVQIGGEVTCKWKDLGWLCTCKGEIDFDDGTIKNKRKASHKYDSLGTYTVKSKVCNLNWCSICQKDNCKTAQDTVTVYSPTSTTSTTSTSIFTTTTGTTTTIKQKPSRYFVKKIPDPGEIGVSLLSEGKKQTKIRTIEKDLEVGWEIDAKNDWWPFEDAYAKVFKIHNGEETLIAKTKGKKKTGSTFFKKGDRIKLEVNGYLIPIIAKGWGSAMAYYGYLEGKTVAMDAEIETMKGFKRAFAFIGEAPDSKISNCEIDWDDGSKKRILPGKVRYLTHDYKKFGLYTLKYSCEDKQGKKVSTEKTFRLGELKLPPEVSVTVWKEKDLKVRADLTESDWDGKVVSCRISWGDGRTEPVKPEIGFHSLNHTYDKKGSYTVTYTCWDDDGKIGKDEDSVEFEQKKGKVRFIHLQHYGVKSKESMKVIEDSKLFIKLKAESKNGFEIKRVKGKNVISGLEVGIYDEYNTYIHKPEGLVAEIKNWKIESKKPLIMTKEWDVSPLEPRSSMYYIYGSIKDKKGNSANLETIPIFFVIKKRPVNVFYNYYDTSLTKGESFSLKGRLISDRDIDKNSVEVILNPETSPKKLEGNLQGSGKEITLEGNYDTSDWPVGLNYISIKACTVAGKCAKPEDTPRQFTLYRRGRGGDKFRVYFVASDYLDDSKFMKKAKYYRERIKALTPFRDCPSTLETEILNPSKYECSEEVVTPRKIGRCINYVENNYNKNFNLLIALDDSKRANGYQWSGVQGIGVYGGIPDFAQSHIAVHEVGHVFRLCDEYDILTWEGQDRSFGCLNQFPEETGLGPDGKCEKIGCSKLKGCCGYDLDQDPKTKEVDIMGGGGGWIVEENATKDDGVLTKDEVIGEAAHPTKFRDESYKAFKKEIQDRGYECQ